MPSYDLNFDVVDQAGAANRCGNQDDEWFAFGEFFSRWFLQVVLAANGDIVRFPATGFERIHRFFLQGIDVFVPGADFIDGNFQCFVEVGGFSQFFFRQVAVTGRHG